MLSRLNGAYTCWIGSWYNSEKYVNLIAVFLLKCNERNSRKFEKRLNSWKYFITFFRSLRNLGLHSTDSLKSSYPKTPLILQFIFILTKNSLMKYSTCYFSRDDFYSIWDSITAKKKKKICELVACCRKIEINIRFQNGRKSNIYYHNMFICHLF